MQVDENSEREVIMTQINCSAALSIEHLSIESQKTDFIIILFSERYHK